MIRCPLCDAPFDGEEGLYCPECLESVELEEETEDIEELNIGEASNAKLTKGFRMMKGE